MQGHPPSARLPRSAEARGRWRRVVVILWSCPVRATMDRGAVRLLTDRLAKRPRGGEKPPKSDGAGVGTWRPDVVHHALLHLLDSPLSRAGRLEVFVRTTGGVLIAVDPRLRVPRGMPAFEAMAVRVLHHLRIRAAPSRGTPDENDDDGKGGAERARGEQNPPPSRVSPFLTLLKVVKNPVTDHLPPTTRYVRVEVDGDPTDLDALAEAIVAEAEGGRRLARAPENVGPSTAARRAPRDAMETLRRAVVEKGDAEWGPTAFIIGGMARGNVEADFASQSIKIGERPMSAAETCGKICEALERAWGKHLVPQ